MEEGIEPAGPLYSNFSGYDTAVHLCKICTILIHNLQLSYKLAERKVISNLLSTVASHMLLNIHTISPYTLHSIPMDYHSKLKDNQLYTWKLLTTTLYSTDARHHILQFLTNLVSFLCAINNTSTVTNLSTQSFPICF